MTVSPARTWTTSASRGAHGAARALRIDPANAEIWYAYEAMERAAGNVGAAEAVYARSLEAEAAASPA